jgi:hypothetical protein
MDLVVVRRHAMSDAPPSLAGLYTLQLEERDSDIFVHAGCTPGKPANVALTNAAIEYAF